ncbi:MAG: DUF2007 domain-containing protein [Candidatus Hydrogenedentes bacterium]|nr:DUF2007 domain-containing protein [Candidatus Hydrogenedentota bacterium]
MAALDSCCLVSMPRPAGIVTIIMDGYAKIGEFYGAGQVAVLQSVFDAAGIDYLILDEYASGLLGPFLLGHGVRILVAEGDFDRAKTLMAGEETPDSPEIGP